MSFLDTLLDPRNRKYVLAGSAFFAVIAIVLIVVGVTTSRSSTVSEFSTKEALFVVGSNFFASNLYSILRNNITQLNFSTNLANDVLWGNAGCASCNTDLVRLKTGGVSSLFLVAGTSCDDNSQYRDSAARTLQQVDVIKRLVARYPNDLELALTSEAIQDVHDKEKIGILISVGGGHGIDSRLSLLRMLYALGVRSMTLTPGCNTPWIAGSFNSTANFPVNFTLTDFGEKVIYEMNRLGMIIDLSGAHQNSMDAVLNITKAPVIFSQSAVYGLFNNDSNILDGTLELVKKNNGTVMVTFDRPNIIGTNNTNNFTVDSIVAHINYIVNKTGIDYVGIGSSYDSSNEKPVNMSDVSTFPVLFNRLRELNSTRWTNENLEKLSGKNFLRVFEAVEKVKESLKSVEPLSDWIPDADFATARPDGRVWQCRTR